jgi:hypothetical protein
MNNSTVTTRRSIQADHIYNAGFLDTQYKKVRTTFYATMKAYSDGWVGTYQTATGEKLVRNGKVVTVTGEDPLQVLKDLTEASKIISLDISDSYVESLNHDGN